MAIGEEEERLDSSQVRMEELLAKTVTNDGRKECYCQLFCSEMKVGTRSKCLRCQTGVPSVLQSEHMQAVRSWSESCSSGDGEVEVLAYMAQLAQQTELREFHEEVKKLKNEGRKPTVQFEEASEFVCEEEGQMGGG